jgi:hypothetical protein
MGDFVLIKELNHSRKITLDSADLRREVLALLLRDTVHANSIVRTAKEKNVSFMRPLTFPPETSQLPLIEGE